MNKIEEYLKILVEIRDRTQDGNLFWKRSNLTTLILERNHAFISLQQISRHSNFPGSNDYLFTVKDELNNIVIQLDSDTSEQIHVMLAEIFAIADYKIESMNIDFLKKLLN